MILEEALWRNWRQILAMFAFAGGMIAAGVALDRFAAWAMAV